MLAIRRSAWNITRVTYHPHTPGVRSEQTPTVTLEAVANRCSGGECPMVYKTNRGTLVVQGYAFEPAHAGVSLPSGEQMVEIPIELIKDYLHSSS